MKEIELLIDCGFNLYESRIIHALNKLEKASAKEIENISQVPKNKIYEILNLLLKKGVVQLLPTKPKKYRLINLKQNIKDNLKEKKKKIVSLEKSINQILKHPKKNTMLFEEKFWLLSGETAMVNKIIEAVDKTQKESIAFIDFWSAKNSNLRAARDALKRGVKFYFLGPINKKTLPIVNEYRRLGIEVKHYDVASAGYSIFDSKYVQLRLSNNKLLSMWIENEDFAKIMRKHFFEIWNKI